MLSTFLGPLRCAALFSAVAAAPALGAGRYLHTFSKQQLSNQFWAEGANAGDFNHDGKRDIVSGPYWWEGPNFTVRHQYAPADATFKAKRADGSEETIPGYEGALGSHNAYSKNFFAYTADINGDGWDDIIILGFPGEESYWYENPRGGAGLWTRHLALDVTDNESPTFQDINGDGRPDIVCASKGFYGYASYDPAHPAQPWTWHSISPNNNYHKFTHGMGVGDVDGDGRLDLLEKDGWWQQPVGGDGPWIRHPWTFSASGGSQMFAYDVNGDGLNDVITGLAAHGYGLVWHEQVRENGEIKFKQHLIMGQTPAENRYGVHFSQLHAVDLVDIDGDGLKDIVVGKRFWAHGPEGDPEPNAPAVLYWFQLRRDKAHDVDWIPHLIDDASGVGTQVVARDVNGDGKPDIIVGNKKGVFVFTQKVKRASASEWEAAQPKPVNP